MVPPLHAFTVARAACAFCGIKTRAATTLIAASVAASRTTDTRFITMPDPPPASGAVRYRNRIKAILGWEIKTYAGLFLLVHNIWYCGSESPQMLWQYCGLGVHLERAELLHTDPSNELA